MKTPSLRADLRIRIIISALLHAKKNLTSRQINILKDRVWNTSAVYVGCITKTRNRPKNATEGALHTTVAILI
jgi:hypothetical protein